MRHGERGDWAGNSDTPPPYDPKIEHDPPLTAKGLDQASQAG